MSSSSNGTVLETLRSRHYTFTSLRPCNLNICTRRDVRNYFENTYSLDEGLFSALKDEKYFYMCPDRLRLPLIFYFAHTATLYVNKLLLAGLIKERVDRPFETMFETGVDEMSWDDTENYRMGGSYKWPSLQKVMEYRWKVKRLVLEVIDNAPLTLPINQEHPWWSIFLGLEHERVHIETSSVLIRQLPVEFLECPPNWKYAPLTSSTPPGPNKFVKMNETEVTIGKPNDFPTYGWDNEYGLKNMKVPAFEATQYLISNGEFLEFVTVGGYTTKDYWTEEGWEWVQYRKPSHPLFWVCHQKCKSNCGSVLGDYTHCNLPRPTTNGVTTTNEGVADHGIKAHGNTYRYRAMYDVIDMPWEWPVDVNYHEAKAYCRWKGEEFRLPTEVEHVAMRGHEPPCDYNSDPINCENSQCNFNLKFGSSSPVNFYPPNSCGFYDVCGNVWEVTEDQFNGLPGFESHYLYDDFSSPCFDGRHNMIQGGSWVSTGDCATRFSRFAFRRHFYQHMGFRMVRSLSTSSPTPVKLCDCTVFVLGVGVADNPVLVQGIDEKESYSPTANKQYQYDDQNICQNYIINTAGKDIDYGRPLVNYCKTLIESLGTPTNSALVAGCGPGYTPFQLGVLYDSVVGVDYGGRLIDCAMQYQDKRVAMCGDIELTMPFSNETIRTDNITFKQLTWFPNELEGYDLIVFEFLDRLNEPKGWLYKLWEMISNKGLLLIVASQKWTVSTINEYIGEWFELVEDKVICDKIVSSWRLKQ